MRKRTDRAAWLKAGDATCEHCDAPPAGLGWRLVLLGPPGCGKGTQAELLSARKGLCHLSTGDLFRQVLQNQDLELTPATEQAKKAIARGELVSDTLVLRIIAERARCLRCHYGILLDGFPRTLRQARSLDTMLAQIERLIDVVVNYTLEDAVIIRRLSGRRTCRGCGAIYHTENKPSKKDGVCDQCGGETYRRDDDAPEAISVRLEAYHEQTQPLEAYYKSQGLLVDIAATGAPEEIYQRTIDQINSRYARASA